jgi:pimeloyl-ACP methyl ester carboxylesterase
VKTILAILLLSTAIQSAPANATPSCAIDTNAPRDAARYDGKRFTVQIEGRGPDLILIPGLSTPGAVWDDAVTKLAKCYTVHVVSIRGFGDQEIAETAGPGQEIAARVRPGPDENADINASGPMLEPFVDELAAYIKKEIAGPVRPAIAGHSLGGLSALMIGARYPDLVGKIMVVDAVPFIGTIFNPAATVDLVKPQAEAMAAGMRATYGKPQVSMDENADPGANSQAGFWSNSLAGRKAVARWSSRSDPRVVAQAFYDDMTTDMRRDLSKITAAVTLLYAQDDSAMTAEAATKAFVPQYAGTPKFEAKMISGSRHFIMLDQPEKFGEAIAEFLKQ